MVKGQLAIHFQKYEFGFLPNTLHKKINSRWNKDLKVRGKTMKTLRWKHRYEFS